MRSAPTTTRSTFPSRIIDAAMLSVMTVVLMPSFTSSQAVRRAPCRNGRVSSASTAMFFPASDAARITQSAGVAVRQDARVVRHELGAERAHVAAALDVLVVNLARLRFETILELSHRRAAVCRGGKGAFHPFDGPEQIDRGRPRARHQVA